MNASLAVPGSAAHGSTFHHPIPPGPLPAGHSGGGGERFTEEKLRDTLAEVCAGAGLDPRGARLLRFTNNAVFELAAHPVVVRIVGSRAMRHRAWKVAWLARWLAAHQVPAVRLLAGLEQPVVVNDQVATLWWLVPEGRTRPGPRQLAGLLRQLHSLPVPAPPPAGPSDGATAPPVADSTGTRSTDPPTASALPGWDPLGDVRRRVADAEELDPGDRGFLLDQCAQLGHELGRLRFPLGRSLVHGDAHLGNVLAGPDGPVLCDFDSACVGPPEWDLTPLAVGVERFGEPRRRYRRFAREYGFDVTDWDGFPVLRRVRELKLTTSVLPILRSYPEVRPELLRRLRDFRLGRHRARWQRYG